MVSRRTSGQQQDEPDGNNLQIFLLRTVQGRSAFGPLAIRKRYAGQPLPNCPLDNKLQSIYTVIMKLISFSLDDQKNKANQKKHRVSFEEAQTDFFDEHAIEYDDPDHSESEDRYLMLGHSYRGRVWL